MIAIALVVLAAFAVLIALRADKIVQGLGWPAPLPALPPVAITPAYRPTALPTWAHATPVPLPGGSSLPQPPSVP
jgi:hypothetical protein